MLAAAGEHSIISVELPIKAAEPPFRVATLPLSLAGKKKKRTDRNAAKIREKQDIFGLQGTS
jgi:hypothetical protein